MAPADGGGNAPPPLLPAPHKSLERLQSRAGRSTDSRWRRPQGTSTEVQSLLVFVCTDFNKLEWFGEGGLGIWRMRNTCVFNFL